MDFVDGFVGAVPAGNKDAYLRHAALAAELFREYGATRVVECWGEDVPEGELTSFPMAVKAEPGEVVVFSWIEWPDRATCDACSAAMETDPRWQNPTPDIDTDVMDPRRMMWGGFEPLFSAG